MWPKQKSWVERWAEKEESKTGFNYLKRSTHNTRLLSGMSVREIRDRHGLKQGEIITQKGGDYQELRDRHGIRLGWYDAVRDMTYDGKTCLSISQGNTLVSLLPSN